MNKILHGVCQFKRQRFLPNRHYYRTLSEGQAPQACFITCADSRLDPRLLTGCDLGELFVIRNAGNIVPGPNAGPTSEAAAIEFALTLGVRDVIVCGHSQCGAMKSLLHARQYPPPPAVQAWLEHAQETKLRALERGRGMSPEQKLWVATQENVLVQLEHVRAIPVVSAAIDRGELQLHGWVYNMRSGDVLAFDEQASRFLPIDRGGQLMPQPTADSSVLS